MDANLRDVLTRVGGIDHCVTEFIRVVDQVYPERVFYRYCPELKNNGLTASGTPVHVQLLGSNPEAMALNAMKAVKLGAPAIDLNFGCPAKTVNKSQGGAVLLQNACLLHDIARAVRKAVPSHIPVSAKIRLGYTDKSPAVENSIALAEAGIQWLCVHARTKTEGYKPPAYWEHIALIKEKLNIPVLANGEIWNVEDAKRCMQISGSDLLMIGRGLVSMPDLGMQIKHDFNLVQHQAFSWQQHLELFLQLPPKLEGVVEKQLTARLKQWLFYFTHNFNEFSELFEQVKRINGKDEFLAEVEQFFVQKKES